MHLTKVCDPQAVHGSAQAHLIVDRSAYRHPVMEDACLQEAHDGLVAPDSVSESHSRPASSVVSYSSQMRMLETSLDAQ